jgi:hypothetical protein
VETPLPHTNRAGCADPLECCRRVFWKGREIHVQKPKKKKSFDQTKGALFQTHLKTAGLAAEKNAGHVNFVGESSLSEIAKQVEGEIEKSLEEQYESDLTKTASFEGREKLNEQYVLESNPCNTASLTHKRTHFVTRRVQVQTNFAKSITHHFLFTFRTQNLVSSDRALSIFHVM